MTVIELLEREDYYSKVEILKDGEIIFSGSMVINSRWYWDCTIEVE